MTSKTVTEFYPESSTVGDKGKRNRDVNSSGMASASFELTPRIPQPKIDATDRRQIEVQNEDKSHTTKDALDDIKRTHYKEKKKKEQHNMEPGPSGINIGWVRTRLFYILNSHH